MKHTLCNDYESINNNKVRIPDANDEGYTEKRLIQHVESWNKSPINIPA